MHGVNYVCLNLSYCIIICCGGSLGSLTLGFAQREDMTRNALKHLTVDGPDAIATA